MKNLEESVERTLESKDNEIFQPKNDPDTSLATVLMIRMSLKTKSQAMNLRFPLSKSAMLCRWLKNMHFSKTI